MKKHTSFKSSGNRNFTITIPKFNANTFNIGICYFMRINIGNYSALQKNFEKSDEIF